MQALELPKPLGSADFLEFDEQKAELGQLLFYDPILSGNRNISCGTCHNHALGSGDALSLGIGEGGKGVGTERTTGLGDDQIRKRIPRNSPALWNLGAKEISMLFHDGRVSISDVYGNGFNTPAEEWLPQGIENILAAQAMFPVTSQFEMAGNPKENEVAGAAHDRIDAVWPILAKRVRIIPEYGEMFVRVYSDIAKPSDVNITHIVNAIGAFVGLEWQSFDSAFDAFLAGDENAMQPTAQNGLDLFFGKAGCATCHSGQLLTDEKFYALALPQFGPGRTRRFDPMVRDVGRMAQTDRLEDAYSFRTPALRNVALTSPYGHNGAYSTLEGIVRHHLDPANAFEIWQIKQAKLPDAPWLHEVDYIAYQDARERNRLKSKIDIRPVDLTAVEVTELVAFLNALTGKASVKGRLGRPERVPSGLDVD
ncbi:MAG: cytochrome c peroxidase [Paracoccaceae bacterium]